MQDYFLAGKSEVMIGPEDGTKEHANACSDELHGTWHPGKCKRLTDERLNKPRVE